MDINATLIGQFITFAILVWFTMKYVWPPITKALHDREKKIAAGLEAAERSKRELEATEHKIIALLREAKQEAVQLIEQANVRADQLLEQARVNAQQESQRIVEMAKIEIDREIIRTKENLKTQLASLAMAGAEKIIQHQLDPAVQADLLHQLAAEI